jgi:hypothetical protein
MHAAHHAEGIVDPNLMDKKTVTAFILATFYNVKIGQI